MANYLTTDTELVSIANAIRGRNGTTATIAWPTEYITAINNYTPASYAMISVTYTSGGTCTCTKGDISLKANDTSGKFIFVVPESGSWVVTCVNGSTTSQKTVSISSSNQL